MCLRPKLKLLMSGCGHVLLTVHPALHKGMRLRIKSAHGWEEDEKSDAIEEGNNGEECGPFNRQDLEMTDRSVEEGAPD
jgi:hypothetical protein